jgi:hypothetical protein
MRFLDWGVLAKDAAKNDVISAIAFGDAPGRTNRRGLVGAVSPVVIFFGRSVMVRRYAGHRRGQSVQLCPPVNVSASCTRSNLPGGRKAQ